MKATDLKKELRKYASAKRKKANEWFFKTGKGQYGYGDQFIGVTMPNARKVAKQFVDIPMNEVQKVLSSKIHEERITALAILVYKFKKGDKKEQKRIYDFYFKNTKYINNWDLVDISASYIVGTYLLSRPKSERKILYKLARSKNMWEQRISIIATFAFIYDNQFDDTYKISDMLLQHEHDLIHKAVGWMIREAGKRDLKTQEKYMLGKRKGDKEKRYKLMPRTMLRYSIEKFAKPKYQRYLKGTI